MKILMFIALLIPLYANAAEPTDEHHHMASIWCETRAGVLDHYGGGNYGICVSRLAEHLARYDAGDYSDFPAYQTKE